MGRLENSRSPDLVEVLRAAMDKALGDLFVALPGRVEKYNSTLQKADIKPLLQLSYVNDDGSEGLDELPVLTDVPVMFPRGGGYFLSFPIAVGDNVLLIFNDRSIDSFVVSTGATDVDPVDLRMHDLSDAVALPGFYPFPKGIKDVIASGAAFGKEKGVMMRATGSAMEVVTAGAPASVGGAVAMATLVHTQISAMLQAGVAAGGPGAANFTAAKTYWDAIFVPPLTGVASSNLKAD